MCTLMTNKCLNTNKMITKKNKSNGFKLSIPLSLFSLSLTQMILFSACCICGLIGGILNFQFVRALVKRPDAVRSLHMAAMSLTCLGISSCTLSTWLTCRLASSEQQRMFLEREHSLHHSHEMAEKVEDERKRGEPSPGVSQCLSVGLHLLLRDLLQ